MTAVYRGLVASVATTRPDFAQVVHARPRSRSGALKKRWRLADVLGCSAGSPHAKLPRMRANHDPDAATVAALPLPAESVVTPARLVNEHLTAFERSFVRIA